jgi:positive regulator of sigma E activity
MGKSSRVQHEGIVKSISTQTLEVSIISHSACSGCHAKSACGIADMKEKLSRLNVPGKSFVRETK